MDAVCEEIRHGKGFIGEEQVHTIYFGGGTPSVLSVDQVHKVISTVHREYDCSKLTEVTLEANPDDVSRDLLAGYYDAGVNRISLGVQSFSDEALKLINRSHAAEESFRALELIQSSPFNNYTADLIFGIPNQGLTDWQSDLETLMKFDPPHISCYSLTFEPNTVLDNWWEKGKLEPVDDDHYDVQYNYACKFLRTHGYEHYELSNYAKPGFRAEHNSMYWDGIKYLGVGPGAHSYNGLERTWNIRNNHKYIELINSGGHYWESESLLPTDRLNEYLMTKLRTSEGVRWEMIEQLASPRQIQDIQEGVAELERQKNLIIRDDGFHIAEPDLIISDTIISSLFCADDPITRL